MLDLAHLQSVCTTARKPNENEKKGVTERKLGRGEHIWVFKGEV